MQSPRHTRRLFAVLAGLATLCLAGGALAAGSMHLNPLESLSQHLLGPETTAFDYGALLVGAVAAMVFINGRRGRASFH